MRMEEFTAKIRQREADRREGPKVYFVRVHPMAVKIGFTSRTAEKRLKELQRLYDEPITLLAWTWGNERLERDIHKACKSRRIGAETFKLTDQEALGLAQAVTLVGRVESPEQHERYHSNRCLRQDAGDGFFEPAPYPLCNTDVNPNSLRPDPDYCQHCGGFISRGACRAIAPATLYRDSKIGIHPSCSITDQYGRYCGYPVNACEKGAA